MFTTHYKLWTEYLSKVLFKRKQILLFPQVMFPLFIKYLSGAHQNFLTRRVWKKNYYWGDIFISSSTNEFYLIIFHSTKVLISYGYRSQKAQNKFGHFFFQFLSFIMFGMVYYFLKNAESFGPTQVLSCKSLLSFSREKFIMKMISRKFFYYCCLHSCWPLTLEGSKSGSSSSSSPSSPSSSSSSSSSNSSSSRASPKKTIKKTRENSTQL